MNFIIGTREIVKKIEKGLIEKVVIAENIPEKLKEKIETAAKKYNVKIETDGNERQLGTKIGKSFPVASVGYYKKEDS
ncbi:MAG: ribosomal L7Ae/L30e/S12e/Gadd45 family protein [Candidatus Aenigmarchaeota archaeon]|nr:ribosomal L7Ae/L30e/S12e/Gadd45 family protein [Candidatus Aenigmarchaeota archaeon]